MANRLFIKISPKPAVTITRYGLKRKKVVYAAVANKQHKYPDGQSSVVYIGTTKKGVKRIADSAANQAKKQLFNYGVKRLSFYVVSCKALAGVESWKKLERALLLTFKAEFWSVPVGNKVGKNFKWKDEHKYFAERRLRTIIAELSQRSG